MSSPESGNPEVTKVFLEPNDLFPPDNWRFLIESLPSFSGNIDKAVELMTQFSEGQYFVLDELRSRGYFFREPRIGIAINSRANAAAVNSQSYVITYVSDTHLAELSRLASHWVHISSLQGEVSFKGYVAHHMFLAGVEEAHHSVYHQLAPALQPMHPEDVSMSEYDAQEVEYRALKWKLYAARKTGMPGTTRRHLTERLQAARAVRSVAN